MTHTKSQTQTNTPPINNLIHHKFSKKPRVSLSFTQPSLTKQSFKDECDINRIMARYQATGLLPNVNELPAQYLDVTGADFQEHQNFIAGAFSMFNELPSAIRAKFSNSPGEFLDFCSHEKNRPELAEMGLLRPITEPVIPNPQPNLSTAQNGSNQVQAPSAA
ncbi:MAG: internal scaffolding protein [Microviridae sp.]|nr:MAG: internal scaffolding protein [Microviridae sp.]